MWKALFAHRNTIHRWANTVNKEGDQSFNSRNSTWSGHSVLKHLQSDIVYAAKCQDCGDTYIGKTERQCSRRLREHGTPKHTFDRRPDIEKGENKSTTKIQLLQQQTKHTTVQDRAESIPRWRHNNSCQHDVLQEFEIKWKQWSASLPIRRANNR